MYNKLLNYFENECCVANIYFIKYYYKWYITIGVALGITIIITNIFKGNLGVVISILVLLPIMITFLMHYTKFINGKMLDEFDREKVEFNWKSILTKEKFNSLYFEFQCKKIQKYCKKNNIKKEEILAIQKYVDEDLNDKYPKTKIFQGFLNVVVPSVISIVTVYLTNNGIKDINIIVSNVLGYILMGWFLCCFIDFVRNVRYLFVNPRRNLLELKDVLRNIGITNDVKKKKQRINGYLTISPNRYIMRKNGLLNNLLII